MKSFLVLLAVGGIAGPAVAQLARSEETVRSLHIAEHSQLGLVMYCRDKGLVGDAAVAAQQRRVAALPPLPVENLGKSEQAEGQRGIIAFIKPQATFADSVKAAGVTVKSRCEQIALTIGAPPAN